MKTRIAAAEEEEAREAERLEVAAQAAREAAMMESLVEEAQDQHESDEDADVEGESEELRALKVASLWGHWLIIGEETRTQSIVECSAARKQKSRPGKANQER